MTLPSGGTEDSWTSPFDDLLNHPQPGGPPIYSADPIFGEPESDTTIFPGQQSYQDTCAIRSQEFVLELFTQQDVDEGTLVQEAADNGWYAPGEGTTPENVGNLLELHGIPVTRYAYANVFHLAHELAQGHKVIIGVDSSELWEQLPEDGYGMEADHAIVVSGIDTSDPANIQVIVSDPGTGEAAARYPMEQFVEAWGDSSFYMVATQDPVPPWAPEMTYFDYEAGHIPEVAGMSYDEFLTYQDEPEAWDDIFDANDLQDPSYGSDGNEHDSDDKDADGVWEANETPEQYDLDASEPLDEFNLDASEPLEDADMDSGDEPLYG